MNVNVNVNGQYIYKQPNDKNIIEHIEYIHLSIRMKNLAIKVPFKITLLHTTILGIQK